MPDPGFKEPLLDHQDVPTQLHAICAIVRGEVDVGPLLGRGTFGCVHKGADACKLSQLHDHAVLFRMIWEIRVLRTLIRVEMPVPAQKHLLCMCGDVVIPGMHCMGSMYHSGPDVTDRLCVVQDDRDQQGLCAMWPEMQLYSGW